ncbi:hypothetical protein [Frigoribacterium sp. VKM Ac-2530]|uniref:hypothetical protein n=1 Tax=Frigoribacterium sp. VKM Ac-2530 TaxID=2783822 RepID=UPI00188C8903|nr:hypothetical protein [Frigoribacterium sp. VKM Ac-2530]MBF4580787.1 hypothetical protein [Frigoribacterium sp. VKM Ac-2530]
MALNQAWHYTTAAGLLGILSQNKLRAGSAAFMNDSDEIRTGKRALQAAAASHWPPLEDWQIRQLRLLGVLSEGEPDRIFLLSASTKGDALTLWRSYGQATEAEYALEFDASVGLVPVMQNDAAEHPNPPPGWVRDILDYTDEGDPIPGEDPDEPSTWGGDWGAVRYLTDDSPWAMDELKRIVPELRKPVRGTTTVPFIGDYFTDIDPSVLFKNAGFQDECEVRMTWTVHPWWKFVLYRPTRFGITPYIEVAAANGTSATELEQQRNFLLPSRVGRLPLRSVRIGPTRSSESAEKALRQLLDSHGYGQTLILNSSAPYR